MTMVFDKLTGSLDFENGLCVKRHMSRDELLRADLSCEVWRTTEEGEPIIYRCIFPIEKQGKFIRVILIIYFQKSDGPIKQWELSPWSDADCARQSKPEGKYTKKMRRWFAELTGTTIPTGGDWGDIDADYDPYNLTAEIICVYREKFKSETEWREYLRKSHF